MTFLGIYSFSRETFIEVCTSGPLQKWPVQVVIVISCHMFAGALDAPPGTRVSYHAECAVISVRSDVKA